MKYPSFKEALVKLYYEQGGKQIVEEMPDLIERFAEENRLSGEMSLGAVPHRIYPETATTYQSAIEYLYSIATKRVFYLELQMISYARQIGYTGVY